MAAHRLRCLIASWFIATMVFGITHCQRRRECDCGTDGNITYVCLVRCGRGGSSGNVVVMPVKREHQVPPLPFLTSLQDDASPRRLRPKFESENRSEESDHQIYQFPLPILVSAMSDLKDLLKLKDLIAKEEAESD